MPTTALRLLILYAPVSSSLRYIVLAIVALLGLTVGFLMVSDAAIDAPRDLPPLYHNARNAEETVYMEDGSGLPRRAVNFSTEDDAATVAGFYHDFMKKAGWSYRPDEGNSADQHGSFVYSSPGSLLVYHVRFDIELVADGARVELVMFAPWSSWHGEPMVDKAVTGLN